MVILREAYLVDPHRALDAESPEPVMGLELDQSTGSANIAWAGSGPVGYRRYVFINVTKVRNEHFPM